MGILNLLKGTYGGKVGATVGSKWKNKGTIRTYAIPSNPNTSAQQTTRTGFKEVSSFIALFSDQIKRLSALDTRGMSVRNSIMHLNADQIKTGSLTAASLLISKGGLPNVTGFTASVPAGLATISCTWSESVAPSITTKATVVVVIVDESNKKAFVGSALNSAETLSIPGPIEASADLSVYYYLLDYRGSSKVASTSEYLTISAPAA